jgi:3D (Asp-Asp-Asp) domain-containing protein
MSNTQVFLYWLFTVASFSFCVQNTSQGAAVATNAGAGPLGLREVRTTAYISSRHGAAKNANGSQLKSGHLNSAAADWSRFPLGTKFSICGTDKLYVVDDYGPALVGTNRIDLCMPSRRACGPGLVRSSGRLDVNEMHHWGVRKVTINIIEPGSYDKSLALLKTRKHVPYVRRMVKGLEENM